MKSYDAVVVGAGPNGLAAAIAMARAGRSVLVVEAQEVVGGGTRSAELTLPGFVHDVCSAIHPTAVVSPFFQTLPLDQFGLEWVYPPAALAHPLDDGTAAMLESETQDVGVLPARRLERSIEATGESFGEPADARAYAWLMAPLAKDAKALYREILGPLRFPKSPLLMARFGVHAMRSGEGLARDFFRGERARALFAGCAAHSILPLDRAFSAAFGLVLGVAGHAVGWPCARGGSQRVAAALARCLEADGGAIETGRTIASMKDLPQAKAYLFDLAPRALAAIAGERLPAAYREKLTRFRHGPGVFKLDWALDGPIPWRAPSCARAGTVHVGGTLAEIAASEAAVWRGEHAERPFVLVTQQSLFDKSRTPSEPAGRQTGWAYCHVPNGSNVDMTARIEAQVERFAPGFRDRILARHAKGTADLERYNANYVGGDIAGGANDIAQLFSRPVSLVDPYATPAKDIFLCSSSTPPGGGVHGMCGYFAAKSALRSVFGQRIADIDAPPS